MSSLVLFSGAARQCYDGFSSRNVTYGWAGRLAKRCEARRPHRDDGKAQPSAALAERDEYWVDTNE
jgi:hypothetical protein